MNRRIPVSSRGAVYLGVIMGVLTVLTILMFLSTRLTQETRRARVLGTAGKGLIRLQQAREQILRLYSSPEPVAEQVSMKVSGDSVSVVRHGPIPVGSGKYVVFAHWEERAVRATLVFDLDLGISESVTLANEELYIGQDNPSHSGVRESILSSRGAALARANETYRAWMKDRREGFFHAKLGHFLDVALDGAIELGDRDRILAGVQSIQPDGEDDTERELRGEDPGAL